MQGGRSFAVLGQLSIGSRRREEKLMEWGSSGGSDANESGVGGGRRGIGENQWGVNNGDVKKLVGGWMSV